MRKGGPLLAAGIALAAASCRQLVGIGDAPPSGSDDAGATCGGFPWMADACTACVQSSCCPEATACREDAVCAAAFDCIARCAGDDVRAGPRASAASMTRWPAWCPARREAAGRSAG